ncbi:hypothetical protein [Lentzea terrae]|uniref:hypothetical protein n=1 Tax=Lentzea terrae TaxID=2200761 RepID=UPI0013006642|nr:hypothetical protein [Lentzea terrae]
MLSWINGPFGGPRYFSGIVGRLRDDSHRVHHFALLAEPVTVLGGCTTAASGTSDLADRPQGRLPC